MSINKGREVSGNTFVRVTCTPWVWKLLLSVSLSQLCFWSHCHPFPGGICLAMLKFILCALSLWWSRGTKNSNMIISAAGSWRVPCLFLSVIVCQSNFPFIKAITACLHVSTDMHCHCATWKGQEWCWIWLLVNVKYKTVAFKVSRGVQNK